MDSFNELWQVVSDYLKQTNSESIYNVWFSELEPISFDGSRAVLMTTAEFKRRILAQKFGGTLHSAFLNALGLDVDVEFIAPGEGYSQPDSMSSVDSYAEIDGGKRASNYFENTFDTFVVGASNKFAHAAAQAVAANPGKAYNPLFIYGNSGLGKTHLLNAICHEIKKNDPSMKIVLTDGEEFTNEFIEALNHRTTTEFQNKYRKVDVLLMDDVQFIASKERTQEEFFHTFNALTQDGKQIVLSSDRPPKDMPQLEDRMRTRFEWGLLADVQPPDLETRMLIVKRKADALNFDISDDVIEYIAQKLKNNIRQLESAVKKMQAYVQIQGANVNTATAQQAIRDILSDNKPIPVVVDKIITEVARTYGANPEDLRSKKKDAQTSKYRQISMYIVREVTGLSAKAIGAEFGGRHYSTVLYALDEIKKESDTDSTLRTTINDIIKNVQEN